ncbi:GTP 3',8-cyclase MoaA [Acinetobacter nematophilus]|uniref:GTP 3',8-cyclase MoaA n=1 Tax=Acinetobacter nematophilus TaxID=2994642 RepID=A0A9X3DWW3_9GAMM|nr:GTP 3',8-cyclase MoaA [Acinetobacter nematophilus]MCX5468587.1 GTP 3',8-cyclase MoaA [Acinetobacter nematophilus]
MNAMTPHKQNTAFIDQHGRIKRKLRISVTDRCNFKCVYCMPEHPEWIKKHDLLSFEELYVFCEFMVQRGIEHIRITGGEPLMRQGVVHFIQDLQKLKKLGLKRVSMTSNAYYLKQYAAQLKQAGLDDLNISLDSLQPSQFKDLTKKELFPVLEGIRAAQQVGLKIKINAVLIKGQNEDQILPLAHWSIQNHCIVRFIEFMPLDGAGHWTQADVVSEQYILAQLKQDFEVSLQQGQSSEPARQYLINGYPIGIISTITHSFCGTCDRVRLTAQGDFFHCLFAPQGISLKAQIKALQHTHLAQTLTAQSIAFEEQTRLPQRFSFAAQTSNSQANLQLQQTLSDYIWQKKRGFHEIAQEAKSAHTQSRKISMYMIGG